MDLQNAVVRIESAAARAGLEMSHQDVAGRPVAIGRRADFKVRWFATRLHTFLILASFERLPVRHELDAFLGAATSYAKEHKGGLPRGLQTGCAAIAVALVPNVSPEALDWAHKDTRTLRAALPYPVLASAPSGDVEEPARLVFGRIYQAHLRKIVDETVRTPLRDP